MGRSVSSPTGARVAYCLIDEDCDDGELAYEWLCEDIREQARAAFPSFAPHHGWRGCEDRILLRNCYAHIGLSAYGGIAAIWIAERDDPAYWDRDGRTGRSPRAQNWLCQVAPRFTKLFAQFERVGVMSNGESVYRRVDAQRLA